MANETDDRDARISGLEAELKAANERLEASKKRALKLEAALKDQKEVSRGPTIPSQGISVVVDGVVHPSIGSFRADNTFVEVKRGHCPEGVTLIAIDKQH